VNPSSQLPSIELREGAHLCPADGVCLMEYVSILVGTRFSDHPRCTDPVLGTLARLVNDSCTDPTRQQLTTFAPALAETGSGDAIRTAAVVRAAVQTACMAADDAGLRRHRRRAEGRHDRVTGAGRPAAVARHLDFLYRRGGGRHHLEASVEALRRLPDLQRDAALFATLAAAIAAASPGSRAPSPSDLGPVPAGFVIRRG
jgi:hypothetical protein